MTETDSNTALDIQDEITKHIAQAQAVLAALLVDEQYTNLNNTDVSSLLWVASDLVDKIKDSNNQAWALHKPIPAILGVK